MRLHHYLISLLMPVLLTPSIGVWAQQKTLEGKIDHSEPFIDESREGTLGMIGVRIRTKLYKNPLTCPYFKEIHRERFGNCIPSEEERKGYLIEKVYPKSPAKEWGLKDGDVIYAMDSNVIYKSIEQGADSLIGPVWHEKDNYNGTGKYKEHTQIWFYRYLTPKEVKALKPRYVPDQIYPRPDRGDFYLGMTLFLTCKHCGLAHGSGFIEREYRDKLKKDNPGFLEESEDDLFRYR